MQITQSQLESYLFKAANILRGPVDHSDFKTYIFPLLFYKRICDVYDEETEKALLESDGDQEYSKLPEHHQFTIPEGAHWNRVREVTKDVGLSLQNSLRAIEKANPDTLYGIFGDAQWTNKERFKDRLILDLLEHFSQYKLSNANVVADVAGRAYEFLIKKFADLSKKKAGEFYTPREMIKLMVKILAPKEGESVYDPACGTGGMLLEAVNHVKEVDGDIRTLKLYGQEMNLTTAAIARMNLILHGLEDFTIINADTLRNPGFYSGDVLQTFDNVIANPPFSLKNWGHDEWKKDRFGRNIFGTPPKSYADFAWVQHMITSVNQTKGKDININR